MDILRQEGADDLLNELDADGVGAEFHQRFEAGERVGAADFLRWQFAERKGNAAIDFLEPKFRQFQIIEHFSTTWRLKVSRDSYSIGYLFGMMEGIQEQFGVSEYSVA